VSSHRILFDGECPMCVCQMRGLRMVDWFHQFALVPNAEVNIQKLPRKMTRADLQAAVHCLTRGGKVLRGVRCVRFVAMRVPLLVPLGLLLWLPGVIHLAEPIYRWVSRNRFALSRIFGCKAVCESDQAARV
jgi:predicted DCC family thiol-disulfide oxidoreductase YuxK